MTAPVAEGEAAMRGYYETAASPPEAPVSNAVPVELQMAWAAALAEVRVREVRPLLLALEHAEALLGGQLNRKGQPVRLPYGAQQALAVLRKALTADAAVERKPRHYTRADQRARERDPDAKPSYCVVMFRKPRNGGK